jgi:hypothetical protein
MTKPLPLSRSAALMAASPETLVRVYSLQHPDAWDAARKEGFLTGNHPFVDDVDGFRPAYEWMRDRMAEVIPDFSGDLPVWAWLKRPSAKPMPFSYGPTIRITALVPRRRLLLSDYDAFNAVLNEGYIADSDADEAAFIQAGRPRPRMLASWSRIFDLSPRTGEAAKLWKQPINVQACIDRIYLDEVAAVRRIPNRPQREAG